MTNEPPVADDQSLETTEGTPVSITLTGSDPDGDTLTYTLVSTTTSGTLDGEAPDLIYTPEEGFVGDDSFTFTASDGSLESPAATVAITVTALAELPATVEPPDVNEADEPPAPTEIPAADEQPVTDEPVAHAQPIADDQPGETDEATPVPLTLTGRHPAGPDYRAIDTK